MKKTLIISFDLIREGEVEKSLAIASLMSYLKADKRFGQDFEITHKCFNMWILRNKATSDYLETELNKYNIETFDTIAISCYVWNEYLINPLIDKLRYMGFRGKIVLGGAQITYSNQQVLTHEYPKADIFIQSMQNFLYSMPFLLIKWTNLFFII